WEAEVVALEPDARVAWNGVGTDAPNDVVVTFERVGENRTRVVLDDSFRPRNLPERVADALGFSRRRVRRDLANFKRLVAAGAGGRGGRGGRGVDDRSKNPARPAARSGASSRSRAGSAAYGRSTAASASRGEPVTVTFLSASSGDGLAARPRAASSRPRGGDL